MEFRSMCGSSRLTEVDLMIDFSQMGLLEKFSPSVATATHQCILTVKEFPLSEYNGTAGRIPPSTSLGWMGESVHLFFFNQPG